MVDVNSGCVHIMDKLAYDILGELEGAQGCSPVPAAEFWKPSAQFDPAQVREAYAELYELYREEKLFARDDYVDIARAIPQGAPVKRFACMWRMTATCAAATALPAPVILGQGRRIMPRK